MLIGAVITAIDEPLSAWEFEYKPQIVVFFFQKPNFQLSQKLERKISHLCVNDLIFLKWFCFDLFYCHSTAFF